MERAARLQGLLLGTAVGDALGLPLEGLSPRRAGRLFPGEPRMRLLPGTGLVSDDTEHTLLVAASLCRHPDDAQAFARDLARGLRWWLLALPAGVGWATLRATLKLWLGVPPARSGVWSAGNGPAMRVALLGAFLADRERQLEAHVRAATVLTHRDPRALVGALAVARLAAAIMAGAPLSRRRLLALLAGCGPADREWRARLALLGRALRGNWPAARLAGAYGLQRGVSGYIYHSVPMAIHCWYRHQQNFRTALTEAVKLGGDTDTVAAIAGALAGLSVGEAGIPRDWLTGLRDWPRGRRLLARTATALAEGGPAPDYCWPALALRNLLFLLVVLAHGIRRLAPPY